LQINVITTSPMNVYRASGPFTTFHGFSVPVDTEDRK